jgi:heat shock protein HtpX
MDEALARNEAAARRLAIIGSAPYGVLVLALIVLLVVVNPGPIALAVLVLVGLASIVVVPLGFLRSAAGIVLAHTGARPATEADEPRLHNLLDGLCVGVGIPKPALWVVDDAAPNALAVARSIDDAAVVVTTGLARELSRIEVEAVLAHQLGRIRRGDAIVGSVAVATLSGLALLRTPPGGWAQGPHPDGGPAPHLAHRMYLVLTGAPIVRAIVIRGEEPEVAMADWTAVEITRYPPGLASALAKVPAGVSIPAAASAVTDPLWLVGPPVKGAQGAAVRRVYEVRRPVAERIEVLEEL